MMLSNWAQDTIKLVKKEPRNQALEDAAKVANKFEVTGMIAAAIREMKA